MSSQESQRHRRPQPDRFTILASMDEAMATAPRVEREKETAIAMRSIMVWEN